jgi:hypothetical protein
MKRACDLKFEEPYTFRVECDDPRWGLETTVFSGPNAFSRAAAYACAEYDATNYFIEPVLARFRRAG